MMNKQSFLRFVFSSPFSKDNSPPEATQFLTQVRQGDIVPMRILQLMPHTIPFTTRLHIFRDLVQLDRESNMYTSATQTIFIRRQHVLEDGFRALSRLTTDVLKGRIRVTFVNELGMEEAGIDQGGPFKGKKQRYLKRWI
jgi:ubiquitin-protein ligase E3 B